MTTATVKAMDNQRCVCRIHLFHFNGTPSEEKHSSDESAGRAEKAVFLRDLGVLPVSEFCQTELLRVFGV